MRQLFLANNETYLAAESFADAEKLYYEYHDVTLKSLKLVSEDLYEQDFDSIKEDEA